MIGLNGGLIGARRSTGMAEGEDSSVSNAGVWSCMEQLKNYRNGLWPGSVDGSNRLIVYIDAASPASYAGSGTAINDLTGNLRDLTGTSTLGFDRRNLGSFFFNGTSAWATAVYDDEVIADDLFADVNRSWSISCWFKFPVTPVGTRSGNQSWTIIGRSGGIATAGTFALFVGSETDTTYGHYAPYKLACVIRGAVTVISTSSVNTDTWNHVALTWNGTSGAIYFNNGSPISMNVGAAALQATVPFVLGSGGNPASSAHAYSGNIAQMSIHYGAISASLVDQHYKALKSRFIG